MNGQIFVRTNLSYLRKKQGITQVVLSEKLGIKQNLLSNYESGRLEMPIELVVKAAMFLGINLSDFVVKDLTKSDIYMSFNSGDGYSLLKAPDSVPLLHEYRTPFYDLPVTAGNAGLIDWSGESASGYFVNIPALRQAEAALPVFGFSMEPEIKNGDVIGVRQLQNWDYIDTASVYMIITHQERMIKRLKPDTEDDNQLWCISNNYAPFRIPKTDILRLFRVVACISLL